MVCRPARVCGKIIFMEIKKIATIHTDLDGKFGLPRQSGLVPQLTGRITFEKEFRREEALRGIEDWSHLWLIWGFSQNLDAGWTPTVRPPRLGGNKRVGVFASRSPFRPNGLGLSLVKLISIDRGCPDAPVLVVGGVDMADGTPIYDIKPYNPEFESVPDARRGFLENTEWSSLSVSDPEGFLNALDPDRRAALEELLKLDPRPRYQDDPGRVYGFSYAGMEIRFRVEENTLIVADIIDKL